MRVAMLCVHSSPLARLGGKEAGGMNVYVRELAREMGRRGIPVDIFTRSQQPNTPLISPLDYNVRVVNLHTGPAAPYDKNWVLDYLPEFVSRVRCFADGEDLHYDIIHSHYWLSGEAALMLRRSWQVPVVHMFHTLGKMKNIVARSSEETETTQRELIEERLLRDVDRVVAATPLDRAQMVWHYGADANRIELIPCGVDLKLFQPGDQVTAREELGLAPQPKRLIVTVGRMEPLKGMDALIRALAIVHQRRPDLAANSEVALIGGGNESQESEWNSEQRRLHQLRSDLGVKDAVHFVGARPQEQIPLFYAAADIVAVPSHYESFGMAALEALACAKPVIASNVGGLPSMITDGDNGFLIPHDNPEALADRIETLLDDPALAQRLAERAQQRAQNYSWSRIARDNAQLYERMIDQQRQQMRKKRSSLLYC